MDSFVKNFLLAFVPMFMAVDAVGLVPLFLGLTAGMEHQARRRIVYQSIVTAMSIAVGFVFVGRFINGLMGVTDQDFKVAGGVLLFIIATLDLVKREKPTRAVDEIGVVPLGTPLIVGPAVLTMSLVLSGVYGLWATLASVVVNIALAGAMLLGADFLGRLLGQAGSKAVSKVAALILAAIAVMMVRSGLVSIIAIASARHASP